MLQHPRRQRNNSWKSETFLRALAIGIGKSRKASWRASMSWFLSFCFAFDVCLFCLCSRFASILRHCLGLEFGRLTTANICFWIFWVWKKYGTIAMDCPCSLRVVTLAETPIIRLLMSQVSSQLRTRGLHCKTSPLAELNCWNDAISSYQFVCRQSPGIPQSSDCRPSALSFAF